MKLGLNRNINGDGTNLIFHKRKVDQMHGNMQLSITL